jgi:hypothetical protein
VRASKKAWRLTALLALAGGLAPAGAQQTDYLTPEEITKVRDTQEPNKRVELFLQFADDRLGRFELALTSTTDLDAKHPDVLRDLLNNFINAVDDTAEALDFPLERGGVDLRKTRERMAEAVPAIQARLEGLQKSQPEVAEGELRYDFEDALMAVQDLLELGEKIPDEPIPPQRPGVIATDPDEQETVPGRPTLKRRSEEKEKEKDPQ